jgi:hypothetical protein
MIPEINKPLPDNFDEMVAAMLCCEQTAGQTVYQHGQSVWSHFRDIKDHIKGDYQLSGWRIPAWITQYGVDIISNLHDEVVIQEYTTFHDCGKPLCRIEENGIVRFPNHAEVSAFVWNHVKGNPIVGNLIRDDMVLHTATADEITKKITEEWSLQDTCTLLLVSLSEIHSNSRLFGGTESVNFKMKWKHLERRGKQICKHCFGEKKCDILIAS